IRVRDELHPYCVDRWPAEEVTIKCGQLHGVAAIPAADAIRPKPYVRSAPVRQGEKGLLRFAVARLQQMLGHRNELPVGQAVREWIDTGPPCDDRLWPLS